MILSLEPKSSNEIVPWPVPGGAAAGSRGRLLWFIPASQSESLNKKVDGPSSGLTFLQPSEVLVRDDY